MLHCYWPPGQQHLQLPYAAKTNGSEWTARVSQISLMGLTLVSYRCCGRRLRNAAGDLHHDFGYVYIHRYASVFEGCGNKASESESCHHTEREGEERVCPRQYRIHDSI